MTAFILFFLSACIESRKIKEAEDFQSLLVPVVFFLGYFGVSWFLNTKVMVKLQPEVDKVEEMNFEAEFDQVDPFEMFDYFKKPAYLALDNKQDGAASKNKRII